MSFTVRSMVQGDVADCVEIINHIVKLGGSTAREEVFETADFANHYLSGATVSNVVLFDGKVVGFQAAFEVESGVYSIGSFTDQLHPVRGAGAAIFAKTQSDCRKHGGTSIIAAITSDNSGGLSYYSKMGFAPDMVKKNDFTRKDGTTVDRVIKRFML